MDTPPKTMTYYATALSPHGSERRVKISLPFVQSIADEPRYQPPPPVERRERGQAFALRPSKRRMEQALDRISYEHVTKRIMKRGY
jgi:hypothetical protein